MDAQDQENNRENTHDQNFEQDLERERQRRRREGIRRRQQEQKRRRQSMAVLTVGLVLILVCAVGLNAWLNSGTEARNGKEEAGSNSSGSISALPANSENSRGETVSEEAESHAEEAESRAEETESPVENTVSTATIGVTGDVMVHDTQLTFAYREATDSFDFSESFEVIKDALSAPDFMIANLETTFGGVDTWTADAVHGYTGYPCFNSPDILAANLKDAGIDFLGTANNHSLDSRKEGLLRTLEVLRSINMPSTGTFSEVDAPRYTVEDVNGIHIALMAYTYGANGFYLPDESKGFFNSFDDYEQSRIDQMYEDVRRTAALPEVDLVAVMLHIGEEYQYEPTEKTREVVDGLFNAGCDLVFGSPPHVLEPFEIRTLDNGDGTTRQGFVIYSLGNFISSQYYTSETPVHKDVGVIVDLDLKKQGDEKPVITGIRLMPTFCQWTTTTIRVIPIESALDSYTAGENACSVNESGYAKLQAAQAFFRDTFWPKDYEYTIEDGMYTVKME